MKETKGLMWGALRVLALVVLLCLAVIAAASNPPGALGLHTATEGSAGSAAAALEVLPASGSVGAMFGIAGSGFQATEVTTLTINGPDGYSGASTVTVDNEGAFVLFWDSSHEPPGSYELTASGGAGSTAEASWDVRPGVLCGESDGFDASALDPAWSWVREDQSHWSLSAQPGALRIQTQAGTLTGAANDQRNLLLRQAPSGNYRLTVQLEVHADQDYQHAGVYLFQDDDHYVRLARGQSSHGVGQGVAFSVEAGGAYTATGTADAASVVYLKLGKQGDVYRGFHSRDGVLWRLVGQRQVAGLNPSQVGLSAANGNAPFATEIAADFEWLRVDELCGGVWLPVVLRAYAPVGRLLINEVMPEPGAGGSEWVELINVGPGPLDLGGHQVSDEDGHVYTIPEALPEVPMQGLVLIRFDGQGAGADDYDLGDKVAVLHSPSGLVDVFEDEGDQVAVYGGTPYGPETIVAFMAYGQHAGEDAANAAQARLWGRLWFVRRYLGLGLAPSDGGPDLSDYSLGLFPGSRVNIPRRWVRYTATESTPGAANPVPAPYFRNPPNGITTTDHQIPFGWSPVLGAVGYRLEVDDDPAFGSPALAVDVAGRIYVPTAPLPDGTFYFRAKTRLADGRESGWSASEQVTFISVAGPASPTSRVELGVTPQLQHKDSRMLCLEGCPRFNVTRWDSAHETDGDWVVGNADPVLISPHDTKYCTRASISMMADYFGGHLSQDRISYYQHSDRGPEGDLDHGSGMWPCESGTQDGTKCALAWALNDAVLISSRGKPTFDQVQDWIDMNRPIVIVEDWDQHTVVLDGYDTNGELAHRVDPWTSSASWVSWNGWVVSEYHVPPVGASARFDEASFSMDSDGDGITDFDEVNRFCTSPDDPDTDNDGIEDKVEIAAYVFAEDGLWEYREAADWETPPDGYRMECDVDNDGDTFPDGCEDNNHNGIFEPDLYETSNFDDDERTGCPELQVQPTVLDFGLNADTRTFEVVNAGGGGLAWEASSLPAWLSLSPDRHVTGPMARTDVEAVLDRSAVGGGKFDSFAIESDYGSLEIAVGAGADSDPPTVDSVSPTEPEPIWEAGCAGASTLDVEARVSDVGSGLDYVQLVFEEVGGQGGSGVPMELVWTPTSVRYEGVLGPVSGGSYEYWVLAADMAGSTSESDYYRIDVYECDPPQISTPDATPGELYLAPCRDGRLIVEVSVSDATGVDTVWLGYTIPAISPERQSVTMDPVGGDSYQATIGPFYTAGTLHFWVSAADTYGALAQTDEQTVEILACEGPTIGAVGQDVDEVTMPPCQPDQVMVFADPVTDDRALESVELWLRGPGDVGWNSGIPMQRRSGTDRWELAVGPLAEAGTWEWKVVARNQIGGQSESEISSTDVLTCGAEPPRFLGVHPDEQYLFLEPCTPDSTTIWAEVAADFPLDQVNLLWSYGSDSGWWSVWSVVPMQFSDSTGEYGAGIGPLDAAGSIQYMIEAVDTAGLGAISDAGVLGVYECQPDGPDILGTQMSSDMIYPEPCTPNALDVQATVVGEPGRTVTAVELVYARGNSTAFQRVSMDPVGGDDYECTISGLTEPDVYRFYIEASNDVGGTSTSSTEGFVLAPCEIQGPTIEDVQIRETSLFESPCEPNDSQVRAWVSDPLGVSSVEICYRFKAHASASWFCSPMEPTQGGWYEGELGDLPLGAWMVSVKAVNTAEVASWSAPGILMVHRCQVQGPDITVRGVEDPISVAPCRPSRAVVQAQLWDQYDIEAVSLVYRLDEGEWQARTMTETVPGEYAAVLGGFDQGGTVTYLVTARNALGGWAASEAATIEVNDCHLPTVGTPTESADPIYGVPCDLTGITIEAEVTDPAGIVGGWLAYRDTDPGRDSWSFVALQQRPGTDRWGADLGPFEAPAVYAYAIYALNNVGGGAWSTADTFRVVSCARPTIGEVTTSETPIYVAPCPPDTLGLRAKIGCEEGVGGAWIGYREAGVPVARWWFTAMNAAEEADIYEGEIGPFGQAMTLEYVIGARSVGGGWGWSEPAQVEVLGCARPTIGKISSSETSIYALPCVPDSTVISVPVSDPLGVVGVALRYRDRTEEAWTVLPMVEGGTPGVYEVTLGSFEKAGLKDYGVVATNAVGLWRASPLQTLTVDACDSRAQE